MRPTATPAARPCRGVCLTTSGSAILNAAAAASQAYSDSVPVLFISPGPPLRHPGLGNGLLHEVTDQSRTWTEMFWIKNVDAPTPPPEHEFRAPSTSSSHAQAQP